MTHKAEWLDGSGYPTEACLQRVRDWPAVDFDGLAAFLVAVWRWDSCTLFMKTKDGRPRLCISTGGWSGNEDLIVALPEAWRRLHFYSVRRGGHWVFERLWHDDDLPDHWTLGPRLEGG